MEIIKSLREGLETGFILKDYVSESDYQPQLVLNNKRAHTKILGTILRELQHCREFCFSVAFLTTSGVAVLYNQLEALAEKEVNGVKGVKGKILVSQYQNFTQPLALERLRQLPNVDLRIVTEGDFHAKGYIFKHAHHYSLIVGSSNLTANALTANKEWNLRVTALEDSKIMHEALEAFNAEFDVATIVDDAYLKDYQKLFDAQRQFTRAHAVEIEKLANKAILPNHMQQEALANLAGLRAAGKNKALLISATGTGKTYLSAFDVQAVKPKRMLFLVHRRTIAIKAMESYARLMPVGYSMGLFSGEHREGHKDFVFSTIQTMSRPDVMAQFAPDAFDYIVIDETHRAGAETYKRVLNYYKPKFLLGMTATPERADGSNVFRQFDYNIAYEIRLNRALDEDMLSPFHYYGVSDVTVDVSFDEKTLLTKKGFLCLTSDERVRHILEKSQQYGTDDGQMRCLVFCNSNQVSAALAKSFLEKGYRALALSGESSEAEREEAIERLESNDLTYKLDYIFTVDIFNEGIDIPRVNQIIMLRPTQSAIVFIQQLGRGLRKTEGKEYLTVIDFIGNYQNNYLVPIALYGDHSYNKDSLRKLLASESDMIPGASTVNFEQIAKERIYAAINSAIVDHKKDLIMDYKVLKFKLGRIPRMMDFVEHGSREPFLYVRKFKSYYAFVASAEPSFMAEMGVTDQHLHLLGLITRELANGKRVEEAMLLRELMTRGPLSQSEFKEIVYGRYGYWPTEETLKSVLNNINFGFVTENVPTSGSENKRRKQRKVKIGDKYKYCLVETRHGDFLGTHLWQELMASDGFSELLLDVLDYGIAKFSEGFNLGDWVDGFVLYRKYSRKDVFRILNWEENPVAQNVGGYMVNPDRRDCAAFVNYHKDDGISLTIQFEDAFVDRGHFDWISKSKRSATSPDVVAITGHVALGMRIPLFVKKHNDEGQDFYYIGDMEHIPGRLEPVTMADGKTKAVRMGFKLLQPVEAGLYRYLTEKL